MRLTMTATVERSQRDAYAAITDLDRVLRVAGMPGARYSTVRRAGTAVRLARARMMGMELAYYETDLAWVAPESFSMRRVFERGPFLAIDFRLRVSALGDTRSEVGAEVEIQPKGMLGVVAGKLMLLPRLRRAFGALFAGLSAARKDAPPRHLAPAERVRLDARELDTRYKAALTHSRASKPALALIERALRLAPDGEVRRLDLLTLAARADVSSTEMVRTACFATRSGLLRLRWDIRCPNCRQRTESHTELRNLREGAHCEMCNLDFTANFEESVEAVFSPHEAVRVVSEDEFCPVGPVYQPTRFAQVSLAPGAERSFLFNFRPGFYVVRSELHDAGRLELVISEAEGAPRDVRYEVQSTKRTPPPLTSGPGMVSVTLKNGTTVTQTLVIELFAAHHTWVSAAMITALAEFRDLFAEQVLAPGVRLGVNHSAFVFTDLKASTAMYEALGDAAAFALVRRHFEVLDRIVREHRGTVVKTIGDAVMAVFARSADALAAAIACRDAIRTFNAELSGSGRLVLKAGVHAGPCLVVNLNDKLDYFGTTVNIAARVQGQSQGDDVVFTAQLAEAPEVARLLADVPDARTPFDATLKGLDGKYALVRLQPAQVPARGTERSANHLNAVDDSWTRLSAGRSSP